MDVFDYTGWMIRFLVDVERNVSRFRVGHVFTIRQAESDVKEVDGFFVSLDRIFQTILAEDAAQFFLYTFSLLWCCFGYTETIISVQVENTGVPKRFFRMVWRRYAPTSSHHSAPS